MIIQREETEKRECAFIEKRHMFARDRENIFKKGKQDKKRPHVPKIT